MALAYDADRDRQSPRRFQSPSRSAALAAGRAVGRAPAPNTISASQARAARRREALSNEQAVSAWLRELAGRTR
jgi:hypothetical protein